MLGNCKKFLLVFNQNVRSPTVSDRVRRAKSPPEVRRKSARQSTVRSESGSADISNAGPDSGKICRTFAKSNIGASFLSKSPIPRHIRSAAGFSWIYYSLAKKPELSHFFLGENISGSKVHLDSCDWWRKIFPTLKIATYSWRKIFPTLTIATFHQRGSVSRVQLDRQKIALLIVAIFRRKCRFQSCFLKVTLN